MALEGRMQGGREQGRRKGRGEDGERQDHFHANLALPHHTHTYHRLLCFSKAIDFVCVSIHTAELQPSPHPNDL